MPLLPTGMNSYEFGHFMRKLRGQLTLREAAEKSGLSYTYISIIEKGSRPGSNKPLKVTPDSLQKLAKAYEHSYEDLLLKAGYLSGQLTLDYEGEKLITRNSTINEDKEVYRTEREREKNDIEKILLNNNEIHFRGETLSMGERLQIIDMIPVIIRKK